MSRPLNRLTSLAVQKLKVRGRYADGGGLYLQVGPTGGKSWLFRYMLAGKAREMGLGAIDVLSLSEAREQAGNLRRALHVGTDPLESRREAKQQATVASAQTVTFRNCAKAYIEAHRPSWRNPKHASQWSSSLATYAYPHFGDLPVHLVDLGLVLKSIEPIWNNKPETAGRVRGRIETILDWATVRGHRNGDNPARWRGHLDKLLPKRSKVQTVEHFAALPFDQIAAFMSELRDQSGSAARALEFLILTAARTSEVIGATWSEFALDEQLWTVPASRIKGSKEHRVPLSTAALALIQELHTDGVPPEAFIFPGMRENRPLSNMAILALLKRMEHQAITAHGFRSTFRDWAAECTSFPREVAEMALAHTIGDKVEAAYRRGDLFAKRRELMEEWARHCTSQS